MTAVAKELQNWCITAIRGGWWKAAIPLKPGEKKPCLNDWPNPEIVMSEEAAANWDTLLCGVGLRCGIDLGDGTILLGLDVDVRDWKIVNRVKIIIESHLGAGLVERVGKPPKVLLPVRVLLSEMKDGKLLKLFRAIGMGFYSKTAGDKIEMLQRGRHFVTGGIHPDTGKPYTLTDDILRRGPSSVKLVTLESLTKLWKDLQTTFHEQDMEGDRKEQEGEWKETGGETDVSALPKTSSTGPLSNIQTLIDAMKRRDQAAIPEVHGTLRTIVQAASMEYGFDRDEVLDWLEKEDLIAAAQEMRASENRFADGKEDGELQRLFNEDWMTSPIWNANRVKRTEGLAASARQEFRVDAAEDVDPFAEPTDEQKRIAADIKAGHARAALNESLKGPLLIHGTGGVSTGWDTDPASLPPDEWLNDKELFLRGAMTAVTGPGGVSKSTLLLNMILDLMLGVGAFGGDKIIDPVGGDGMKVLWLSADDMMSVVRKRVAGWRLGYNVSQKALQSLNNRLRVVSLDEGLSGFRLTNQEALVGLEKVLVADKIDMLVLDPLLNLAGMEDENSSAGANLVLDGLRSLAARLKVAVSIIHHERKAQNGQGPRAGGSESVADRFRGSSAFKDAMRGTHSLNKLVDGDHAKYGLPPPVSSVFGPETWRDTILESGKINYAARHANRCFRLNSVSLGNATSVRRADNVAYITELPVANPTQSVSVSDQDIQRVLNRLKDAHMARPPGLHEDAKGDRNARKVFCSGEDPDFSGERRLSEGALRRILTILRRGGYTQPDSDRDKRKGIQVVIETYAGTRDGLEDFRER